MKIFRLITCAAFAAALWGCASPSAPRRASAASIMPAPAQAPAAIAEAPMEAPRLPVWAHRPPRDSKHQFFVGETHGAKDRNEALERAWISAFVRIGMTEFPELTELRSRTRETMRKSEYQRDFAMNLERVDWTGVREAVEFQSPFVWHDARTGTYSAYRLLKWPRETIRAARHRIHQEKRHAVPFSPEAQKRYQADVVDRVHRMQLIAKRISRRDALVEKVLSQAKCGVTIDDLIRVLGEPDRRERVGVYWGTFEVAGDPKAVRYFTANNGEGKTRTLCDPASSRASEAD